MIHVTVISFSVGMTKVEQDEILELFKEGNHKVIIATSVAEEGLDIQKCSLVVRYDHVTNEIAMVQSRGNINCKKKVYLWKWIIVRLPPMSSYHNPILKVCWVFFSNLFFFNYMFTFKDPLYQFLF